MIEQSDHLPFTGSIDVEISALIKIVNRCRTIQCKAGHDFTKCEKRILGELQKTTQLAIDALILCTAADKDTALPTILVPDLRVKQKLRHRFHAVEQDLPKRIIERGNKNLRCCARGPCCSRPGDEGGAGRRPGRRAAVTRTRGSATSRTNSWNTKHKL